MSDDTLAEDTDLTMAMHRAGWRVVYEETARAWTEAPATLGSCGGSGTAGATARCRRCGSTGARCVDRGRRAASAASGWPTWPCSGRPARCSPRSSTSSPSTGCSSSTRAATAVAWVGVTVLQLLHRVVAFRLDREPLRPLWALPLQQFVYRQLMYLVLLQSAVTASPAAGCAGRSSTTAATPPRYRRHGPRHERPRRLRRRSCRRGRGPRGLRGPVARGGARRRAVGRLVRSAVRSAVPLGPSSSAVPGAAAGASADGSGDLSPPRQRRPAATPCLAEPGIRRRRHRHRHRSAVAGHRSLRDPAGCSSTPADQKYFVIEDDLAPCSRPVEQDPASALRPVMANTSDQPSGTLSRSTPDDQDTIIVDPATRAAVDESLFG